MFRTIARIASRVDIDNGVNRLVDIVMPRMARRFQVLVYHKISYDSHPFFEPTPPDIFEEQMRFLSRCYQVLPLIELVERSRKKDLPSKAVAITFDDGYRDNYEHAFPILKRYRLPATVFVTTGAIGNGEVLWHDRIFDSFRFATVERARLPHADLPELMLQSLESRRRSLSPVLAKAKTLSGDERLRFLEEIENALRPRRDPGCTQHMLTWQQLREMQAAGIDCGSHTVTHTIMSRIPRDEMFREVRESKRHILEHLGTPVCSFAYPNGHDADYNSEAKAVLRDAGYSCAVTSRWGINHAHCDPFEIRRGQPSHHEIELFRLAFLLQRHSVN